MLELSATCARLRGWLPITRDRLEQDLMLQWAVERGLQVAAETLFDVGNHLLSSAFDDAANEYRQVPVRLAAHGVLSAETAAALRGLAGFRNVLVHDYARVDLDRVLAGLDRLGDFDAFLADLERWLERQPTR